MKLLEQAELLEAAHHHETENRFDQKQATLYIASDDGLITLASSGDVYQLIDEARNNPLVEAVIATDTPLALTTCGWAAPRNTETETDNELAPSQHPERRRVALFVVVNNAGEMASVLRFSDTPQETITDNGEARGTLATALLELMSI
jgi:hypothetical protein